MTDLYGPGLWGDEPTTSTDSELERRRGGRASTGGARLRAVAGGAVDWLTPNLAGDALRGLSDRWDVYRTRALEAAGLRAPLDVGRVLSQDEANRLYGIEGALSFDRDMTENRAAELYERTRRDLMRQDVIARAQDGGPISDFMVSLGVGIVDPVNVLIPVGRIQALRAALPAVAAAEASERIVPRMLAGGAFGAIEGAAISTAMEPGFAGLAALADRDYTLTDSLINIVAGAGFGGIVGGATGALDVRADRELLPDRVRAASEEVRGAATLHSVHELAEGRPVEAARVFDAQPEFQTALGSTYVVHDDGTTTRVKAPRAEHPGDEGLKPRSVATVFVTPEVARALATPEGQWRVHIDDSGVSLLTRNQGGAWGVSPSQRGLAYERAPREGLIPVEVWRADHDTPGAYREVHFGNPIVKVRRAGETAAPPRRETPRAPEEETQTAPVTAEKETAPAARAPDARRAQSREAVAAIVQGQLSKRFGADAAPMAQIVANVADNLGAHYGETAEQAFPDLRIENAYKASLAQGRTLQQAAPMSRRERKAHRRNVVRAEKDVQRAQRQAVAFAAAAECAARNGFGPAGHGMVELMAGNTIAAGVAAPLGIAGTNALADDLPQNRDPEEWLAYIRRRSAAILDVDELGYLDAPVSERAVAGPVELWAPLGEPPPVEDKPGVAPGLQPSGAKVPPPPASFGEAS